MIPLYMPGWNLNIPEYVFDEIYAGKNMDKGLFKNLPTTDVEFIEYFLTSKLWRMNNLYTIIDKLGRKTLFRMNWSQHMVHNYGFEHPRLIILKSRQQGISTYYLIKYFDDAETIDDLTIGLMAQGKRESAILLTRTKMLIEELDPAVSDFLSVGTSKDNTEAVEFLNNSKILIGVSFRSQTLQRLHISEFGKIANENPKRAEETKTGTLQAIAPYNDVAIESTAEGDNEFKYMWDEATEVKDDERGPKDFLPVFLSWFDDPDCKLDILQRDTTESLEYFSKHEQNGWVFSREQKNWWISQYRELKTKIKQEYPLTAEEAFEASRQGAYWHQAWQDYGIETPELFDPRLPVYATMDLGINDTNTVFMFQYYNKRKKIIWEYGNNNRGVRHYSDEIKRQCLRWNIPWPEMYLPHDGAKRQQGQDDDLKTVADLYAENGFKVSLLDRPKDKHKAVENVRSDIEHELLEIDAECKYAIKTMANYSKVWDAKLEEWKKEPLHNYWSHWADNVLHVLLCKVPDHYKESYGKKYRGRSVSGGFAI